MLRAAIAEALAAAGAAVAVNYASGREAADRVVAEITAGGGRAIALHDDVSKSADVQRVFADMKERFGALDILVNNAGVYRFSPLGSITEEEFHRHFNINVLGLLLATQAAARHSGDEGGSVINIGSVVSQITRPGSVIYTATKAPTPGA